MTFDRLFYIGRLKDAGIAEPVVPAHAEALRVALLGTVATKMDLDEAVRELKNELKTEIGRLDHRIDLTARDLTIKGAGGLVITATLIVGLKLFG